MLFLYTLTSCPYVILPHWFMKLYKVRFEFVLYISWIIDRNIIKIVKESCKILRGSVSYESHAVERVSRINWWNRPFGCRTTSWDKQEYYHIAQLGARAPLLNPNLLYLGYILPRRINVCRASMSLEDYTGFNNSWGVEGK